MAPCAPARFSITSGWPSSRDSASPTMRAVVSTPLPGPNGTSTVTGRWG